MIRLISRDLDEVIAISEGEKINCRSFLDDVKFWTDKLPEGSHVINLCVDRYLFMVVFSAVLQRGQCNLLLAGHQPEFITEALKAYPDACVVCDQAVAGWENRSLRVARHSRPAEASHIVPEIPDDQLAAIVFTSGSTGASKPIPKTWGTLRNGALINRRYLLADDTSAYSLIATVPPWHMYGLEWSVMLSFVSNTMTYSGGTFFPDDIRLALERTPGKRILISTPLHLRALLSSGIHFPEVETVLCATAPLDTGLARDVESLFAASIFEIYGCSEAGAIAYRWPVQNEFWTFMDEFRVERRSPGVQISARHVDGIVELGDTLSFQADGSFLLEGRNEDLVKVAGKRASLGDLNFRLLSIEGIEDGVIYDPESFGFESDRLSALIVSESRNVNEIRQDLARAIDPVFVPRPIKMVKRIPRSETGKLHRNEFLSLIKMTVEKS